VYQGLAVKGSLVEICEIVCVKIGVKMLLYIPCIFRRNSETHECTDISKECLGDMAWNLFEKLVSDAEPKPVFSRF